MNVLVINCGSSSLKYQLITTDTEEVLAKGLCERIGLDGAHTYQPKGSDKIKSEVAMPNHTVAVKLVIEALTNPENGVIKSLEEIDAVGHRIVHGGEKFSESVVIDEEVIKAIEECNDLAPLHNPANLIGIEACKALKHWNDNGHPEYKVNVNLSVVQLMQNDVVQRIAEIVEKTGINPHNLTLEVTESLAINDMGRMKKIMDEIRAMGIRIALDDFGTGYSSLNHIREIPLDVIKVDRSFVQELAEDDYSRSFIKMVAELAGAIDVSICVEGVETKAQIEILEDMNVRLVQGYFFDKPMKYTEFNNKYM